MLKKVSKIIKNNTLIMDKKIAEELKNILEIERVSLKKELGRFATEDKTQKYNWEVKYPNREDGTKDEEADEAQEYDNLLSLDHSLEIKLRDVDIALEKIEKGNYGKCSDCGKEIEEERLKAAPEAKLCMGCNKKSAT
jgi:RNA polymerase-binding transcription factor DksA